jgi:hypothetical protein
MKKEILALMVTCLVLTFSAAIARAKAVSISQARVDWASLALAITGDITWSDKGSQSYVHVKDATGSDKDIQIESGWVDTSAFTSIAGSGFHASGNADTNDNYLYEKAYAFANDATMWAYAEANALRWGYFTANSDGYVTFSSAVYELSLSQGLETGYANERAYGYAEAGLWLLNNDTSDCNEDIPAIENKMCGGNFTTASTVLNATSELTAAVWFNAGDRGEFDAWVYNMAEVEIPEPATICLLGLGASSLLRKRSK